MNPKNVFLLLMLSGIASFGSTNFCLGMEVGSPYGYDCMSLSSSEESSEVDDIQKVTKKLNDLHQQYKKIDSIKSTTWKYSWGDPRDLKATDITALKNHELNTCDQGWIIFRIICKIVKAQTILKESQTQHGPPGVKISDDLFNAIASLNAAIKFHERRILNIIIDFDVVAAHRLFWLLAEKYPAKQMNTHEFYLLCKPLISEQNYSRKQSEWLQCVQGAISRIPTMHIHYVQKLLATTIQLPINSKLYALLGIDINYVQS